MRKLASIAKIDKTEPIEGADKIEIAKLEDKAWKVVVGKGEFKPGDLVVYFEIDSALPADDGRYAFLHERCLKKFVAKSGKVLKEVVRIKTIKLRGVYSQGLVIHLDKFPEITERIVDVPQMGEMFESSVETREEGDAKTRESELVPLLGADVTSLLRVEHYDELTEALRPQMGAHVMTADAYGPFPSQYIPKTDEERIQNLTEYFDNPKMKDRKFEVTVKADGTSVTMFYSPTIDALNPFGVCTRNLRLKPQTVDGKVPMPWLMAAKYGVEEKLKHWFETTQHEYALQGELVGPGIQSNRDLLTEHEWRIFRIFDITASGFLDPARTARLCREFLIPHVTVIAEELCVFRSFKDVDEILKFAEGKTARGNEREGVVFKSDDGGPYVSFKAVSNKYLLKQE